MVIAVPIIDASSSDGPVAVFDAAAPLPDAAGECPPACDSCNGSTCVNFDPNSECAANCSIGNDCNGCCCIGLEQGGGVCVGNFCQGSCSPGCSAIPSMCNVNGDCCEFGIGGAYCVNFPDLGGICAASCTFDSDCASNCCLGLSGGGSACGPVELCGGAAPTPEPGDLMHSEARRAPGAATSSAGPLSAEGIAEDFLAG